MSIHKDNDPLGLNNENYPILLKEIPDRPEKLYYRGNLSLLREQAIVAIVGTRKASAYGMGQALKISGELANHGVVLVSGLARGIDGVVHKSALDAKGKTIAVLGTGVDEKSIYPPEHKLLAKQIVENGGLLISEYENGKGGAPWHFPARNRIIAGISHAVVVIEAPEKSGALITAFLALDYNREVFALPGPVTSPTSVGCNKLISLGARVIIEPSDVLAIFDLNNETNKLVKPKILFENVNEEKIVIYLQTNNPSTIAEIAENIDLEVSIILQTLTILEIKNIIFSHSDGKYSLK